MKVTLCDYEDCGEYAVFHVTLLDGELKGWDFDACTLEHAGLLSEGVAEKSA